MRHKGCAVKVHLYCTSKCHPFAGIGSEGHVAIGMDRQFVGAELKQSYWQQAVKNLQQAEHNRSGQLPLAI